VKKLFVVPLLALALAACNTSVPNKEVKQEPYVITGTKEQAKIETISKNYGPVTPQATSPVTSVRSGYCWARSLPATGTGYLYNEYYDCTFPAALTNFYTGNFRFKNTGYSKMNVYYGWYGWNGDWFLNNWYKYEVSPGGEVNNPWPDKVVKIFIYVWDRSGSYQSFQLIPN
jgi:hypothetical protein